ncbi:MAG: hypothetical protein AB7T06_07005 [Kofleriaceae bacterium]
MKPAFVLALLAGCQLPVRTGVTAPTRHGFGGVAGQLVIGGTGTKDLRSVRIGGGGIVTITGNATALAVQTGPQAHADFVVRKMSRGREFVLATRIDAGFGRVFSDSTTDEKSTYSFGAFVGPGLAYAPKNTTSGQTWTTVALGVTAQRITIDDRSAWFVGAALELAYGPDFASLGGSR